MNEVCLIDVTGPKLLDLRANALRPGGDQAWHVFLTTSETDLWLSFMDTLRVQPLHFDNQAGLLYAKLAVLFGEPWDVCWDDPHRVLREQREALESITDDLRERLRIASLKDVERMRRDFEPAARSLARGDRILLEVAGVEPMAARN